MKARITRCCSDVDANPELRGKVQFEISTDSEGTFDAIRKNMDGYDCNWCQDADYEENGKGYNFNTTYLVPSFFVPDFKESFKSAKKLARGV